MKPHRSLARLIAVLCLVTLAGCAAYPYGMTKAHWDSLTPGQRAALRNEADRQARALERNRTPDGTTYRAAIQDDNRTRSEAPVLTPKG